MADDGRSGRELLRNLRERVGLTQALLAERAGLSERAISDIERGEKQPREDTLRRLIGVLQSEARGLPEQDMEAFRTDLTTCQACFHVEARRRVARDTRHPQQAPTASHAPSLPAQSRWRSRSTWAVLLVAAAALVAGALVLATGLGGRTARVGGTTTDTSAVKPGAAEPGQAMPPVLVAGSQGVDVQTVQLLLRHRGHGEVAVTGSFDAGTDQALRTFQGESGLAADGVVGPQTWDKLLVNVRQGSVGDAVVAVQVQLNHKRGSGLEENGQFDAVVRDAVLAFQQAAGITVDGIVGPETWRHLLAAPVSAP